MYKSSFGIKNFVKNHQNPFEIKGKEFHENSSTQKLQIPIALLPTILSLSRTGIRLLLYFIETNSSERGIIYFNLKECKRFTGFGDKRSVYNGLIELLGENIIARTEDENIYYLNLEIIKTSG
jgi:hypothetical protein